VFAHLGGFVTESWTAVVIASIVNASQHRRRGLPNFRLDLLHSSGSTLGRLCVPRNDALLDQYPFSVSYALISSRVAAICKSVLIALSDPSLRLFLASTNARSVRRSFSKSSSMSKVIATSRVYLRGPSPAGRAVVTRMGQRRGSPSRAKHDPSAYPGGRPIYGQY
jgi:hypothetical protein